MSAAYVAELAAGIAALPARQRRARLENGLDEALRGFEDRILGFTTSTALRYGVVVNKRVRIGRPISITDAQIAAISLEAGAMLATRNTKDFDGTDVSVIDPWHAASS